MSKRIGRQTVRLAEGAVILSCGILRRSEGGGRPLGKYFDQRGRRRRLFGEATWELAESKFVEKNMATDLTEGKSEGEGGRLYSLRRFAEPMHRLNLWCTAI